MNIVVYSGPGKIDLEELECVVHLLNQQMEFMSIDCRLGALHITRKLHVHTIMQSIAMIVHYLSFVYQKGYRKWFLSSTEVRTEGIYLWDG